MVVKMSKLFRTRRRLFPLVGAFFLFLASSTVLDITRVNSGVQWSASNPAQHQFGGEDQDVRVWSMDSESSTNVINNMRQSVSDKQRRYHYGYQHHSANRSSSGKLNARDDYSVRAWLHRGIKERRMETSSEDGRLMTWSLSDRHRKSVRKRPTFRHVMDETGFDSPVKSVVSNPIKRLPQALIIGVKKCGTRALLEFLRLHPDIRAAGPETHFFDKFYNRKLDWYKQQMPPSLSGQITMEKTPSYFITRDVPERIHAMSPRVKLLVVVRDPVTRALSDYTQTASKRREMAPFEKYAFLNDTTGLVDTTWSVIKIGVYARYLEWWLTYFPMEQIHFISGESLVREPAAEMALVQDFLGLKRVITDKHFYFNETKGFPCLKKSEGNGSPHCLGKSKGRTHPDISPATVQRLRDFYRPFNVKFYQMVNRDFAWP